MALLMLNSGSSSLKFGLYAEDGATLLLEGAVELGAEGTLEVKDADGRQVSHEERPLDDAADALPAIAESLGGREVRAVGHRMVHGGPRLTQHCALTPQVLATLEASVHFAPLHIPPALELVRAAEAQFAGVPQFACFDTAFHQTLPPEAYTYGLPLAYREAGVRRYGFHGLSYESIVRLLGAELRPRTVVAHLGSGASLCALREGVSVDTSMGLSPSGGVPMGTRTGDLDPGVPLLLTRKLADDLPGLSPDALEQLVNHEGGLKALAGESDVRKLTARAESGDAAAGLALTIFARDVAKTIAAYASVLGGLELLVFAGGIGEHSAKVRQMVCERLAWMGIRLADEGGRSISAPASSVTVLVEKADETGQMARHVARLLAVGV